MIRIEHFDDCLRLTTTSSRPGFFGSRGASGKSVRSFKGIICVDISEFESYMPSHAVGLSQVRSPAIVRGSLLPASLRREMLSKHVRLMVS
jgi:hypothetical protein